MKVFLDTNVLVSAFASRGICADILELVLLEHDLLTGENVLRELGKALRQNDFRSCALASAGSFCTGARRFRRVVGL